MTAKKMTAKPLPDDIEARIAACEAIVAADEQKIDETLESLDGADGTPEYLEEDTSLVHHIEDVRRAARRASKVAASASTPPATLPVAIALKAR